MNDSSTDYPDADTGQGATGLSVSQAAEQLGLSANAVRHKIRRGTLPASKLNGEWRIHLVADSPEDMRHRLAASPRTGAVADSPQHMLEDRPADRLIVSAQQQVDVLRDSLVAPLVALTERQQTIIAEQAEAIGRMVTEREHERRQAEIAALEREAVGAERDALLAAQDALRSRIRELETASAESPDERTSTTETRPQRVWWQFWKR